MPKSPWQHLLLSTIALYLLLAPPHAAAQMQQGAVKPSQAQSTSKGGVGEVSTDECFDVISRAVKIAGELSDKAASNKNIYKSDINKICSPYQIHKIGEKLSSATCKKTIDFMLEEDEFMDTRNVILWLKKSMPLMEKICSKT